MKKKFIFFMPYIPVYSTHRYYYNFFHTRSFHLIPIIFVFLKEHFSINCYHILPSFDHLAFELYPFFFTNSCPVLSVFQMNRGLCFSSFYFSVRIIQTNTSKDFEWWFTSKKRRGSFFLDYFLIINPHVKLIMMFERRNNFHTHPQPFNTRNQQQITVDRQHSI